MAKRIFIAINLPENVKKKLANYREKWPDIPARWTKEYNLHITLVFLGYTRDEDIPEIIDKVKEAAENTESFEFLFNKICYGPIGKEHPKMVWATGEESKELGDLRKKLEDKLFSGINQNIEKYIKNLPTDKKESKPFSPHITLARLKQGQFARLELEEIPEINEEINIRVEVNSIEIMESQLKRGGPDYTILESIEFKL